MSLRSFRIVPLVPMETSSSSSDDSCDSFGSDGGFANTVTTIHLRLPTVNEAVVNVWGLCNFTCNEGLRLCLEGLLQEEDAGETKDVQGFIGGGRVQRV